MNFEIVSYCSAGFVKALELTLPSWIENSGAGKIVVYTDLDAPFVGIASKIEVRRLFVERSDDGPTSWMRKIEVIQDAINKTGSSRIAWLDADVYCAAPFDDAFNRIAVGDIGATRMFNPTNRGYGQLNAGVLFLWNSGGTRCFLNEWKALSEKFRPQGGWFEQAAATQLLREAFHGQRSYYATPVSENLYNLEDDDNAVWLERIERYRPKLIHFKTERWKDQALVARVLELTSAQETCHSSAMALST